MGSKLVPFLSWLSAVVLLLVPVAPSATATRGGNNPFFFGRRSFTYTAKTPHGSFKVLRTFSHRPELHGGAADSYRLGLLRAAPRTFVLPSHWDADELLYVLKGLSLSLSAYNSTTLSLSPTTNPRLMPVLTWSCRRGGRGAITQVPRGGEGGDTQDICEGDVLWVPAGTMVYLLNADAEESLRVAVLLKTVSSPTGDYRVENPFFLPFTARIKGNTDRFFTINRQKKFKTCFLCE